MLDFASKPNKVQEKMPSPENHANQNESPLPEQPVRELTQTDRLNNKLLKSFLDAMNTGQVENPAETRPNNDEEDRAAEFED